MRMSFEGAIESLLLFVKTASFETSVALFSSTLLLLRIPMLNCFGPSSLSNAALVCHFAFSREETSFLSLPTCFSMGSASAFLLSLAAS